MKRTIEPLFLVGDDELALAVGISTPSKLKELRDQGLPYYHNGKSFCYDPVEVKNFLKKIWKLKEVNVKIK